MKHIVVKFVWFLFLFYEAKPRLAKTQIVLFGMNNKLLYSTNTNTRYRAQFKTIKNENSLRHMRLVRFPMVCHVTIILSFSAMPSIESLSSSSESFFWIFVSLLTFSALNGLIRIAFPVFFDRFLFVKLIQDSAKRRTVLGTSACVKAFSLIIMVKIANTKMKILIMTWVMMEIFNILIGSLIGGSRSETQFRKKTKASKSVTESDTLSPDDSGWAKTNGLTRPRSTTGIKMFKTKNVGFLLKWIVKTASLLINSEEKVCFDLLFEICAIFHCLLVSDGKTNCN